MQLRMPTKPRRWLEEIAQGEKTLRFFLEDGESKKQNQVKSAIMLSENLPLNEDALHRFATFNCAAKNKLKSLLSIFFNPNRL